MDWIEYINLAQQLNNGTPDEAKMRSAVSRAYYGAFCLSRNYLGLSASRVSNIHEIVISRLKESDNTCEISIGNILDGLRKNRNEADYSGVSTFRQTAVAQDILNAFAVNNNLSRLRSGDCD